MDYNYPENKTGMGFPYHNLNTKLLTGKKVLKEVKPMQIFDPKQMFIQAMGESLNTGEQLTYP